MQKKHKEYYAIQLKFLLENKDRANLLYLYCQLRQYTIDRAGYIPQEVLDSLSNHKRYVLLPKLRKLGWVVENKLISTSTILQLQDPDNPINLACVKLNYKLLNNLKKFKAFIFASLEAYILRGKYSSETKGIERIDRDTHKLKRQRVNRGETIYRTERTDKNGLLSKKRCDSDLLHSYISHSMLEKWGYKKRTISRLRKFGINKYRRFLIFSDRYNEKAYFSKVNQTYVTLTPVKVTVPMGYIYYTNYNNTVKGTSDNQGFVCISPRLNTSQFSK